MHNFTRNNDLTAKWLTFLKSPDSKAYKLLEITNCKILTNFDNFFKTHINV